MPRNWIAISWALRLEVDLQVLRQAVVAEGPGDLLGQPVVQAVDQVAHVVGDVAHVQVLPAAVARVEDLAQVGQDLDHLAIAGQWAVAQVMDRPAFLVGLDDPLGDRGERLLEPRVRGHATDPPASSALAPALFPWAAALVRFVSGSESTPGNFRYLKRHPARNQRAARSGG